MHYVLSFDAESTAQSIDTWVPAVGICLVDSEGTVILKRRWHIAPTDEDATFHVSGHPTSVDRRINRDLIKYFDARTYNKFWANFVPVFLEFQASLRDPKEAWTEILNVIQSTYSLSDSVVLASDCPDFDAMIFNSKLKRFTGHDLGIRYMLDGERRHAITNPVEILRFVHPSISSVVNKAAKLAQRHDHRPENDAHHTAIQTIELWKFRQQ